MWTGIGMAVAGLGSALIGSEASKSAAGTGAAAAERAAQTQSAMYGTMRSDLSTYRNAGAPALQRLMYLTGVGRGVDETDPRFQSIKDDLFAQNDANFRSQRNGFSLGSALERDPGERARFDDTIRQQALKQYQEKYGSESSAQNDPAYGSLTKDFTLGDFAKDPGYDFRKAEGEKAIERSMSSRGLSSSTPGLQALMKYNQDYASNEYGAAYGRFREGQSNKFNMLSYLSGTGQNAAAMTGQAGVNTGAGMSGSILAGGQMQAAGTMGAASSFNNALQGGLGNYMYQQRYNQMMQRMPVFNSPAANNPSYGTPAYQQLGE